MERYKNLNGDSGISGFEISPESIAIEFKGAKRIYVWSYRVAGSRNVEEMKRLATAGSGLNSFIQNNVRKSYDR